MESWVNALLKVTVGWQQQAAPTPAMSEVGENYSSKYLLTETRLLLS